MKRILLTGLSTVTLLILGAIIFIGINPDVFVSFVNSFTHPAQILPDPAPTPMTPPMPATIEPLYSVLGGLGFVILIGIIIAGGVFLYFLPTFIGGKKRNAGAIFVLNLLTGWCFIGWVGALVWACTADTKAMQEARFGA